jgi:hypothetical protein
MNVVLVEDNQANSATPPGICLTAFVTADVTEL